MTGGSSSWTICPAWLPAGTAGSRDLFVQPEAEAIFGIGTAFAVPTPEFVALVLN